MFGLRARAVDEESGTAMSENNEWTIGRLLQWTGDYLKTCGSATPRLDAELLLAEACGCQRIELYTTFGEIAGETTRAAFRELVRRRAEGMPVAYLLGRKEFYSLSFRVTSDVLIPRPETEFVVITLLDLVKTQPENADRPVRVADVGTGSGILAVCAAKHIDRCQVVAMDISPAALVVARANVLDHGLTDRVELIESDLFAALPDSQRFDYIVSNPPYVSSGELETLASDVKDYEPRCALIAGQRGTEVIERLVPQAAQRLVPGGWLVMEIGPTILNEVHDIIAIRGDLEPGPVVNDLAGLPRVVRARRV